MHRWEHLQRIQEEDQVLQQEKEALKDIISELEAATLRELDYTLQNHSTSGNSSTDQSLKDLTESISQVQYGYLPDKLVRKKTFFSALTSTVLNDRDKERIYEILQSIYRAFQKYYDKISAIPPTKHAEPRNSIIREAEETLQAYIHGATTKEAAFLLQVSEYLSNKYYTYTDVELQRILNQIFKAIQKVAN